MNGRRYSLLWRPSIHGTHSPTLRPMGRNDHIQLDLTESISDVPQANNISLFVSLMEALGSQQHSLTSLSDLLDVNERTVRYYTDFGRWLRWIVPAGDGSPELTSKGRAFVDSVPARGRLFANALFARPLIQTVQRLKREQFADESDPQATHRACRRAIDGLTTLSEATIERRASALSSMLRWAYNPGQLDWSSGRPARRSHSPFDFQGQSFLTAYAARRFGGSRSIHIGFPCQVVAFATGDISTLDNDSWDRANYSAGEGSSQWFGSIPVNPSTRSVARRQGPDLRRLLIGCNPYLAMLITLMTSPSPSGKSATTLTADMYGLRLWHRNRELGSPLQALARLATSLQLVPVETVPHLENTPQQDEQRAGTDGDFQTVLEQAGIVRAVDTSLILAPGVGSELRHPLGDGPTLWERMEPLREDLQDAIRGMSV